MAIDPNAFIAQIREDVLNDLAPTPLMKIGDVSLNDFKQRSFGSGAVCIFYSLNGTPLGIRVSGGDDNLDIASNPLVDSVRTIQLGDVQAASRVAEILETLFPVATDEPRRRLRRVAAPLPDGGVRRGRPAIPKPEKPPEADDSWVLDPKTRQWRPGKPRGRKKAE